MCGLPGGNVRPRTERLVENGPASKGGDGSSLSQSPFEPATVGDPPCRPPVPSGESRAERWTAVPRAIAVIVIVVV